MPTLTLNLEFCSDACRETAGWLIAGDDPRRWLDEIAAWPVPHAELRLIVVPRSVSDRRPRGVLVVGPCPPRESVSPVCRPYGRAADRLYLPVDARLGPHVEPRELSTLLHAERDYVWAPHGELVACDAPERLRLSDLLQPATMRAADWDHADAGEVLNRTLAAVMPEVEPTLESMFQQQREEIGDAHGQLDQLPPSPDEENSGPFAAADRRVRQWLADFGEKLSGGQGAEKGGGQGAEKGGGQGAEKGGGQGAEEAGGQAEGAGWVHQFSAWLGAKLKAFDPALRSRREQELARLLSMLEQDPDRGLHYALPLNAGPDAHRGVAEPSGQLGSRHVDFNLGRLGGGDAADPWFISAELQQRLWKRYRELAEREVQLGRYRRAAYIFAELLNDLRSAAATLRAGRHWREAAALYQRLGQQRQAAGCLEEGGLLLEAIELYRNLGELERVGDLYARLENMEAARAAYQQVVTRYDNAGDFIQAARVLELKLQFPEEALYRLREGWPDSAQAPACLEGALRLLAHLGRHNDARQWLDADIPERVPQRWIVEVAALLSKTAGKYPDEATRHVAAHAVRKLVADRFPTVPASKRGDLLNAVRSLAPADRLLSRDCQRFLQNYAESPRAPSAGPRSPSTSAPRKLRMVQSFRFLPPVPRWSAAVTADNCVYAAAITGDTLVVRRFRWDGHGDELDRVMWHLRPGFEDSQVLLVPPGADRHLLVHVIGHPQLAETKMAASSIGKSEITCGAVDGMSDGVLAATRSEFGGLVLLESGAGKLELVTLRGNGPPHLLPLDIPAPAAASHPSPLPFHVRREVILLGLRNELMIVPPPHHRPTRGSSAVGRAIRVPSSLRLSGAISAIIGSAAHTRSRVALALDIGGVIYWDVNGAVEPSEIGGESSQRFSEDMLAPVVGLNRSGLLMAINSKQYEVYSTHNQRLQLVADGGLHSAEPIAVLAPPNVGQFGVMMRTGEMRILEVR